MKIVLDTNFLISCLKFKIDFLKELQGDELFIVDKTRGELEKLIKGGKAQDKQRAKLSLMILKKKKIKIIKSKEKETVDDTLARLKNYIIATQDKELKKRIKGKKLIIRAKKKLEIQ
jgi:rRNA-processing protein FCF1